jgi:diguanylate cyclase (GGDEF)-like protein
MKTPESSIFFAPVDERTLPKAGGEGGETRKPTRAGTKVPTGIVDRNVSSRRIEYLQEQMKVNSRRDLHLWMVVIVVVLVLAVGLAGVLAPGLVWKTMSFHLDFQYLPQLFWGMIVLVALFSIYATAQKREVNATRTALIQELIISEHLQAFSFLDPTTQLLNSCAIENIASREIARANRSGSDLSFAAIRVENCSSLQKGLESEQGDQLLYHAARLLKATFRGSDAVFRSGAVDFLVVMPETSEQQAEMALSRLKCGADHWNSDTDTGLELSFSYGIATHVSGGNSADVIERARRCMFLSSQQVNLVF